jgi:hypothetical protein
MSDILHFPPKDSPLCTDEAATGGQIALDALLERDDMPSRDDAAAAWADNLMDDLNGYTREEARNFLAGFLSMVFTFFPPVEITK